MYTTLLEAEAWMENVQGGNQDPILVLILMRLPRSGLLIFEAGSNKAPVEYRLGGKWVVSEYDEEHLYMDTHQDEILEAHISPFKKRLLPTSKLGEYHRFTRGSEQPCENLQSPPVTA